MNKKKIDKQSLIKHIKNLLVNFDESVEKKVSDKLRSKLKEAAIRRSNKYNIKLKEGGNLVPPQGYSKKDADYGDPVNYLYLINDGGSIKISIKHFEEDNDIYTKKEKEVVYNRIVMSEKKYGLKHKSAELDSLLNDDLKSWINGEEEIKEEKNTDVESQKQFDTFVKSLKEKNHKLIYDPTNEFHKGLPEDLKNWSKKCKINKNFSLDDDIQFTKTIQARLIKSDDGKGTLFLTGEASNTFVDKQRERVSTAFLEKITEQVTGLPLLYEHKASIDAAIGVIIEGNIIGEKVIIKAKLESQDQNKEVKKIVQKRDVGIPIGLSIGGRVTKATDLYDDDYKLKYRLLEDGEIYEVSATVIPAINNSQSVEVTKH